MDASNETAILIRDNWQRVLEEVAEACSQAGRDPETVSIVGVSKYVGPALTAQLVAAGCATLGENRPQVLWEKTAWFEEQGVLPPTWHMIGHLQRNKVRRTLPLIACIHSVDSLRLAKAINTEAAANARTLDILLEINPTDDEGKTGVLPGQAKELAQAIAGLENVNLTGLMAMSTHHAEETQARREFAAIRELRDQLAAECSIGLPVLSMGMSGDFREAIAEGATLVRIGSNLWQGIR